MSPLCSRNARSRKTLVGRAQWGTLQAILEKRQRASLEKLSLVFAAGLVWEKARLGAAGLGG